MKTISVSFLLLFLCSFVLGQGVNQEAIQKRLADDASRRLLEREMQRQERSLAATPELMPAAPAEEPVRDPDSGCLDIKRINISGIKAFSVSGVLKEVRPLAGQGCVNKEILKDIQSLIQGKYVNKGYIGARVYFDFKDLNEKRLNIIVDEGVLENIIFINPKDGLPLQGISAKLLSFSAFPFTIGRPLNLKDIEQGLEQMNKLASNNTSMEVRPGEREGGSEVLVFNESLPKNTVSLSYDNSGTKSTGEYRGALSYSRDNLLSLNENIYININDTLWENKDKRYSRGLTSSIEIPFGYWTVSDSVSYSKYLTTTQGTSTSLESSGDSFTNTFSLERTLSRGKAYKINSGLQFTFKQSKNYFEDVYIESSSRILSIGSLYITGLYYSGLGSFYTRLSADRGLKLMGSKKDIGLNDGDPKAQFTALDLYLNYSKNFGFLNYAFSFNGQYGFDDMFASEQLMIGGEGSVRGFKEQNAFGESGLVIRQDLSLPISVILGATRNEYINLALSKLYAGAFVDYGYVAPKTYGGSVSLAGAGAKISYFGEYISGGFAYARSIYHPSEIPSEGNVFYFNLALNIKF